MTATTSARTLLAAATFLAIAVAGAPAAFAADRSHQQVATHEFRSDTQIHTSARGTVPYLSMQSREAADDPLADIHME